MTRILDLHRQWLADANYAREYEALEKEFSLARAVAQARLGAGLTQTDLAARLQTTESAIARLEGGSSVPSTRTLKRIADATGTRLRISFEPDPTRQTQAMVAGEAS